LMGPKRTVSPLESFFYLFQKILLVFPGHFSFFSIQLASFACLCACQFFSKSTPGAIAVQNIRISEVNTNSRCFSFHSPEIVTGRFGF
jgi:hypothetical protein